MPLHFIVPATAADIPGFNDFDDPGNTIDSVAGTFAQRIQNGVQGAGQIRLTAPAFSSGQLWWAGVEIDWEATTANDDAFLIVFDSTDDQFSLKSFNIPADTTRARATDIITVRQLLPLSVVKRSVYTTPWIIDLSVTHLGNNEINVATFKIYEVRFIAEDRVRVVIQDG